MRKKKGKIQVEKLKRNYRRKLTIRQKVVGTAERLRLSALKSNKHLSVQLIDDVLGKTVLSMQTFGKNKVSGASKTVEGAKLFGKEVAQVLLKKNIQAIVFDRNGRRYTGAIAALADSLRANGIQI